MARKQTSAAKPKKAQVKVPKKLYKALKKEGRRKMSLYLSLLS
jgi:hypothetical protein